MENIANLKLPNNVEIFIYADDITIVCRGGQRLLNAQKAIDMIAKECERLGLKVNSMKTKVMAVKQPKPQQIITLEDNPI